MSLPLEVGIVIVAFTGNIFLALFTLLKNPKSQTNKLFFLFTLSIASYVALNYQLNHQLTDVAMLFWVRMVMSIAVIIDLLFFLLALTFPKQKLGLSKPLLWLWIVFSILLIILAQINLIFTHATPFGGPGTPGPAMPLFLLHTILTEGLGFYSLIKKRQKAIGTEKNQLNLFLLGAILMFLFILITNLFFIILLHTAAFIGLLPIYSLVFIGCISYAIIKHRFLDIQLIVARSVAYAFIVLVLGAFYTFYLFVIGAVVFRIPFSSNQFIFYGFIMFIVAFTFQPLRNHLEIFTDTFFYKGHYDSEQLLKHLSDVMSSTIILETLTMQILGDVLQEMRITKGAFMLLKRKDHGHIDHAASKGYMAVPYFSSNEITHFIENKNITIFDDLEEGAIKESLRNRNIAIILPLMVQEEKIGLLCLGEKASGDIYQEQDINVLSILAPQLSVAIQNAKEYDEIKQFNVTLREEVDKATKELQQANEKLKELDRLKDEFVSLASHELRTPMTAIKSYLWLVLRQSPDMGALTQKQKLYVERTYNSTERLIKLVNDMLNVSRIESGRLQLAIKPTNIFTLANDVLTEVTPSAQNQHLTVSVEQPQQPLPLVLADTDKIKEVLINLVGNSLKFTPAGGKITISFSQKEHSVIIHVSDTGKGIKEEDMIKLFQKFSMIEGNYSVNPTATGTGLGLYISKSIINMHGGVIWAESEGENKGTTFSFSLQEAQLA